jgi:hypothetical protein
VSFSLNVTRLPFLLFLLISVASSGLLPPAGLTDSAAVLVCSTFCLALNTAAAESTAFCCSGVRVVPSEV